MNTHTVVFKNTIWNWIVFQFFKRFAIKEKSAFGIFGNLCFDTEKISMSERTPTPQDIHFPPSNIFTWIIWALFGNVRDGVLGDRVFNPEQKDTWLIRINWWFRNPFHNLTWYVIGFADKVVYLFVTGSLLHSISTAFKPFRFPASSFINSLALIAHFLVQPSS